jgi:hypothetical protein
MTVPPLPPWREPITVDGEMTKAWRAYFEALERFMADHEARLTALE